MGSVWRGIDTALDRQVAIKFLGEAFTGDGQAVRRFTREARAAARLSSHANVVTIFDVGEYAERPFIVMEYMPGGTVAEQITQGPVDRVTALQWLADAGAALDFAHGRGIVHRDVKPSNMLIGADGAVRLADFGIASLVAEPTISSTGQLLGTASYISPEQAEGSTATEASDRYALAVTAFELLTGQKPFTETGFAAQARAHIESTPPRASEIAPGLSRAVDSVLRRGMAKQAVDRWPTARDFSEALDEAVAREPERTRRIAPIAFVERPPRAHPGTRTEQLPAAAAVEMLRPHRAPRAERAPRPGRVPRPPRRPAPPTGPSSKSRPSRRLPAIAAFAVVIALIGIVLATNGSSPNRAHLLAATTPGQNTDHAPRAKRHAAAHGKSSAATAAGPAAHHSSAAGPTTTRAPGTTISAAAGPTSTAPTTPAAATGPAASPTTSTAPVPSGSPEELEAQGHQLMLQGQYAQALPLLRQAVASSPTDSLTYAYALYDLGRTLRLSGDPQAAIPILEERLKIPNQPGAVSYELHLAQQEAGQDGAASPQPAATGGAAAGAPTDAPTTGGTPVGPSPGFGHGHGHAFGHDPGGPVIGAQLSD